MQYVYGLMRACTQCHSATHCYTHRTHRVPDFQYVFPNSKQITHTQSQTDRAKPKNNDRACMAQGVYATRDFVVARSPARFLASLFATARSFVRRWLSCIGRHTVAHMQVHSFFQLQNQPIDRCCMDASEGRSRLMHAVTTKPKGLSRRQTSSRLDSVP